MLRRRGSAAVGVGVVAGHDGPFRRQRAHEMRVAVIDDVKHVEIGRRGASQRG